MPQRIICQKCDACLYETKDVLKSPDEIIQDYDGKCPNCGNRLSYMPIAFEVEPIHDAGQQNLVQREVSSRKKVAPVPKRRGRPALPMNRDRWTHGWTE